MRGGSEKTPRGKSSLAATIAGAVFVAATRLPPQSFAVLAPLTNALKAPVLCLLIDVIEHAGYGVVANRLLPFSRSVDQLCQHLYPLQRREYPVFDQLSNRRNNH